VENNASNASRQAAATKIVVSSVEAKTVGYQLTLRRAVKQIASFVSRGDKSLEFKNE